MTRRVRQKTATARLNAVDLNGKASCSIYVHQSIDNDAKTMSAGQDRAVDWSCMSYDTMSDIFAMLNYRDRASLACVCKTWRFVASFPSLWKTLDLRPHILNTSIAASLAKRCHQSLQILKLRGDTACATCIRGLQAEGLRHLTWEECSEINMRELSLDMHMGMIRREVIESLHLSSKCVRGGVHMSIKAISLVTNCTPNLKRLRLAKMRHMDAETIKALVKPCPKLTELGFLDCNSMYMEALISAPGLRFLSFAGSTSSGFSWSDAVHMLSKLPNLIAIDASRTDITPAATARLLCASQLRVLCALSCPKLETDQKNDNFVRYLRKSRVLISRFSNIVKKLEGLDAQPQGHELRDWAEWVLSHALLRTAESSWPGEDTFWLRQGVALTLRLLKSKQEDVQEKASAALATFLTRHDQSVRKARAEAVMKGGGITLLLDLAESCQEGVQSESAKAISRLCVNTGLAKAVAADGGIQVCATLARSRNCWVAGEAAGALWSLSAGGEHRGAIAQAGAIEALVNIASKWASASKWPSPQGRGPEGVLWRTAGALADLTLDNKCGMEVASAGGVGALVMLLRFCKYESVQEQAAQALSNLSFSDKFREAIAVAGGVEALVALVRSCHNRAQGLQVSLAGALWNLSESEAISIAIGLEGGVAPLIALSRFYSVDVHETAAGALWSLAFNPGNSLLIVKEEGVSALGHLCLSSQSKMARFMAALALAYILDGGLDKSAAATLFEKHSEGRISANAEWMRTKAEATKKIDAFLQDFLTDRLFNTVTPLSLWNPNLLLQNFLKDRLFNTITPPSLWNPNLLLQIAESVRIEDMDCLLCNGAQLERFLAMLRNRCEVLQTCATFALLQFTMPRGIHTCHHVNLLQAMKAERVLRRVAAAATATIQAKTFAQIVLRNLEQ